jgi:hypothetical protein
VFSYDNANHLAWAEDRPTPNGAASVHIDYKYDALGNRIERDVTSGGTTTKQKYGYDGKNVWADLDGSGNVQARYFFLAGSDQIVARVQYGVGQPLAAWYLTDRQGSVLEVLSNQASTLDQIAYDAFGNITSEAGAANGDRYKYTGRERDEYTAFQLNGARWYDPRTMRWTGE